MAGYDTLLALHGERKQFHNSRKDKQDTEGHTPSDDRDTNNYELGTSGEIVLRDLGSGVWGVYLKEALQVKAMFSGFHSFLDDDSQVC